MRSLVVLALCAVIACACSPTSEPAPEGNDGLVNDKPTTVPADPAISNTDQDQDPDPDEDKLDEKEKTEAPKKDAEPPTKPEGKTVAFRDAKGQLLCPVMQTKIESEDKAIGYQDYNGKRYYFCCGDCPKLFAKDPEKWLKLLKP